MNMVELIAILVAASSAGGLLPTLVTVIGNKRKQKALDSIEHEVKPNAGGSLRDAVNRIEQTVAKLVAAQEADDQLHKQGEELAKDVLARLGVLESDRPRRTFWRR